MPRKKGRSRQGTKFSPIGKKGAKVDGKPNWTLFREGRKGAEEAFCEGGGLVG